MYCKKVVENEYFPPPPPPHPQNKNSIYTNYHLKPLDLKRYCYTVYGCITTRSTWSTLQNRKTIFRYTI